MDGTGISTTATRYTWVAIYCTTYACIVEEGFGEFAIVETRRVNFPSILWMLAMVAKDISVLDFIVWRFITSSAIRAV